MTKARDLANGATALSSVSVTELSYLDGLEGNIQTQLEDKVAYTTVQNDFVEKLFGTATSPLLISPEERVLVSATAATGTINFDCDSRTIMYYTSNASGDWTLNLRGGGATTIDNKLAVGDSMTVSFLVTNGSTAYKHSALTIDGVSQTVKWSGGTAPSAGNASAVDAYSFTIIKTADNTYTVLGAGPIKYA